MNEHEAARIAAAVHELRPDWPTSSVMTLIRKHLIDKPRRDVSVALAWVACESATANPARVLEMGPWWKAAGVEGSAQAFRPLMPEERCGICAIAADRHARVGADHAFEPDFKDKRGGDTVREIVQALKAEVQPLAEPTAPRETAPGPRSQEFRDIKAAAMAAPDQTEETTDA